MQGKKAITISEIARWFDLPPHKIKDIPKATLAIQEETIEDFCKYLQNEIKRCIGDWLSKENRGKNNG